MRCRALALCLIGLNAAPAAAQQRVGYGRDAMQAHHLSTPELSLPELGYGYFVRVAVSPAGEVIEAVPDPLNPSQSDPAPAVAAARQARFRPFVFKGRPVTGVGSIWVSYGATPSRRTPKWENPDATFPAIDHSSLQIELVRAEGCDGYKVTIDGTGNLDFGMLNSNANGPAALYFAYASGSRVAGGSHRKRLDRATLDALIERFRAVRFFGLRQNYVVAADDCADVLRLRSGGREMVVRDGTRETEAPPGFDAIRDAIATAADSERWMRGDDKTVAALLAEGINLRGVDGAYLAAAALRAGNEQVVLDTVAAGAPLDSPFPAGVGKVPPLGAWLVTEAAEKGATRVIAMLEARGWLTRVSRPQLGQILARTAGACEPSIIRALVKAGADVNARRSSAGLAPADGAGATALFQALKPNRVCDRKDPEPAVEALLSLGADVNIADDAGMRAIFVWPNDVLALHLLEAGAQTIGRDASGRTLRQIATGQNMPATLAWLDTHGLP